MKKFLSKSAGYLLPAFLVFLAGSLCFVNFQPGHYLLGWDSLHPEFNFPEAFGRVLGGVWRAEQGVGVVAAHAHMADLPRLILVWFASLILPLSFLRWSWFFLCLIMGPLGLYSFLRSVFKNPLASFLGAVFYLLNLITVQHFLVPFEMFAAAYGFLPWLFNFGFRFVRQGRKKDLILFALFLLLGMPMAYASLLFYASVGGLFLFLFVLKPKRALGLFLLIFCLNSFWILPNLYSLFDQGHIITRAKTNLLFSPEAFLRSQSGGNPPDVVLGKSFLLDWQAFDFNNQTFTDLMAEWNHHLAFPAVSVFGWVIVAIWLLGLLIGLVKKEKAIWALVPVVLFCLFFLLNTNPPLGSGYAFFYQKFSLFREGLRFPFTKFSLLFSVCLAVFFGYFWAVFFNLFRKGKFTAFFRLLLVVEVVLGLGLYLWPAFRGQLISPVVKTQLPVEYLDLFRWFRSQPQGRVAFLPLSSRWGWHYAAWRYEGSGFLTYGLTQPLLDRDFDRWSPFNEDFYHQASQALADQNLDLFKLTLQKYRVKYLLWDGSVISPGGEIQALDLGLKPVFNAGFLTVYQFDRVNGADFVTAPSSYSLVNADLTYAAADPLYAHFGDYILDSSGTRYPFVNFDPRGPVQIKVGESEVTFKNKETHDETRLPIEARISESFAPDHGYPEAFNCELKGKGKVTMTPLSFGRRYRAEDGGVACDYFIFDQPDQSGSAVLHLKGRNLTGRGLKIYLFNWKSSQPELEELLPRGEFNVSFVVSGGQSTLNVETRSFGRIAAENEIDLIEMIPFAMDKLQDFKETPPLRTSNLEIKEAQKIGTAIYKVKLNGDGLLTLNQGYDRGWVSYPTFEHVKVNAWANGWLVPNGVDTVYLFFWPQLLEWGGLALGLICLLKIAVDKRK